MRNRLQRYYGRNEQRTALHHFQLLPETAPAADSIRAKMVFVRILGEVRDRYEFQLVGYVLMPNHVHLLIGEPVSVTPSLVMQVLKQRVARTLTQDGSGPEQLWQRRFYDFNVYSRGKVREKLNYMHANPVTAKLVTHPKDWPWSSWSFYECGENGFDSDRCGRKRNSKSKTAPFERRKGCGTPS